MTPNYQLANIQQAIEAHFADIDRLGIRQGNNRVTTTTIFIDNAKAISITSSKSKICVCKIHDPRIRAILNSHQSGIMFLNSSYSCMFGYDQARLLNTITLLINVAIPNCTNDRITHSVGGVQKKLYLLLAYVITVINTVITCICVEEHMCEEAIGWFIFGISVFLIIMSHYIVNICTHNRYLLTIAFILGFIIYETLFVVLTFMTHE